MNNKYKERDPKETINLINSFFEKKGFNIVLSSQTCSYGTWSTVVNLYFNHKFICNTNGKGVSKELSEASGLGELYERFCGFYSYHFGYLTEIKSYSESKNIKENILENKENLSPKTYLENSYNRNMWYPWINNVDLEEKLLSLYSNNNISGFSFTNVITGEKIKQCPSLLANFQGSNGLACGNSFHEAFNQGLSEIVEREAMKLFLKNENLKYKCIKPEFIDNEELKEIINNIENDYKKIYLIDLGYTFNLPVIAIIVVDFLSKRFSMDFGCFPVFDIAVERCLTESTQNVDFLDMWRTDENQTPYKLTDTNRDERVLTYFRSIIAIFEHNEKIIDNLEYVTKPSSVFCDKNLTNKEIYEYWKKYIIKNDYSIFVNDLSLTEKLSVVKLYSEDIGTPFNSDFLRLNVKKENIKILLSFEDTMKELESCFTGAYNEELFVKIFKKIITLNRNTQLALQSIYCRGFSFLSFFDYQIMPFEIDEVIKNILIKNCFTDPEWKHRFYINWINKYALLNTYKKLNKYNDDEILKILLNFDFTYTKEDLEKYNDYNYLLIHIFYKPSYDYFRCEDYNNIIKGILKNDK